MSLLLKYFLLLGKSSYKLQEICKTKILAKLVALEIYYSRYILQLMRMEIT